MVCDRKSSQLLSWSQLNYVYLYKNKMEGREKFTLQLFLFKIVEVFFHKKKKKPRKKVI